MGWTELGAFVVGFLSGLGAGLSVSLLLLREINESVRSYKESVDKLREEMRHDKPSQSPPSNRRHMWE